MFGISPKILNIASSNKSCDDFAPNINLFGLMLPHGVLNVATALESGCRISWWYPCFKSILENTLQSWNLQVKPSTTGDCKIRFLSMYLFGTLKSTLARIICGSKLSLLTFLYLGFGCTTKGEHHVIGSPESTFSKMSCLMHSSSHFRSGYCR